MKSYQSLGYLKNMKFSKKKQLSNRIRNFFIVNFPVRPELAFLSPFVYWEYEIDSFCGVQCIFEWKVYKESIIIWRKITLKVTKSYQISRVHTKR